MAERSIQIGWGKLGIIVASLCALVGWHIVRMDGKFAHIDAKFATIDARFATIDTRFANMDARLSHIEERMGGQGERLAKIEGILSEQRHVR